MTHEHFEPPEPPSIHASPEQRARSLVLAAIDRQIRGAVNTQRYANPATTDEQQAEWYEPMIAELEAIRVRVAAGFPDQPLAKPKPRGVEWSHVVVPDDEIGENSRGDCI